MPAVNSPPRHHDRVAAPATEHPWHPLTDAAFLRAALASALRAAGITVAAVALSVLLIGVAAVIVVGLGARRLAGWNADG